MALYNTTQTIPVMTVSALPSLASTQVSNYDAMPTYSSGPQHTFCRIAGLI